VTELLVLLGAAVGAPVRFALGEWLDDDFPTGTLLVNVVASALLGVFGALALSESAFALLGTGFCGGMSTYSAFAVQTHRAGRRLGPVYAAATIVLSVAACALGFWVGQA
jgi:fluoride exporter